MSKHTPGPWTIDYCDGDQHYPYIKAGQHVSGGYRVSYIIADKIGGREPAGDRSEVAANARLLAAAPDLLEALQLLMRKVECGTALHCEICDQARAAIAKARGGA